MMENKDVIRFVAELNGMSREEFLFQVQAEIDSLPEEALIDRFGKISTPEEYVEKLGVALLQS